MVGMGPGTVVGFSHRGCQCLGPNLSENVGPGALRQSLATARWALLPMEPGRKGWGPRPRRRAELQEPEAERGPFLAVRSLPSHFLHPDCRFLSESN